MQEATLPDDLENETDGPQEAGAGPSQLHRKAPLQ